MGRILALVFAVILGACASGPRPYSPAAPRTAWIVGQDGRQIGQAAFTEAPHGVLIRLEFSEHALTPGWHGVHFHQVGNCADFAGGFQASGSHVGHGDRIQHGLLNTAGPEAGDLPNIMAPTSGEFGAEMYSARVTLGPVEVDDREPLLDADGSALVIHAGPDDQQSQPIGGAGARVGCAALTQLP